MVSKETTVSGTGTLWSETAARLLLCSGGKLDREVVIEWRQSGVERFIKASALVRL